VWGGLLVAVAVDVAEEVVVIDGVAEGV